MYPVLRTPSRQANGQGVRPILQLRVLASTSFLHESLTAGPFGKATSIISTTPGEMPRNMPTE